MSKLTALWVIFMTYDHFESPLFIIVTLVSESIFPINFSILQYF